MIPTTSRHLATEPDSAPPLPSRRGWRKVVALLVFVVLGGSLVLPCLCRFASLVAPFRATLFMLVALRLAYTFFRGTFRYGDYLIYFGIYAFFCFWSVSLIHGSP